NEIKSEKSCWPELLFDFTALLRQAFDLESELGKANHKEDLSYLYRPSISSPPQNNLYQGLNLLIDLVIGAWEATAEKDPQKALDAAQEWWHTPYPIFKRLSFFAATKPEIVTQKQALDWLLADDNWWLWDNKIRREVCRLLVSLAPRLKKDEKEKLEKAILQGPPREMYNKELNSEEWESIRSYNIWLRLAKLKNAGIRFALAEEEFKQLTDENPNWQLKDDGQDEFPFYSQGIIPPPATVTPRKLKELKEWLKEEPKKDHYGRPKKGDWPENCRDNLNTAFRALRQLAGENIWPPTYWAQAFGAWQDYDNLLKSWRRIKYLLEKFPIGAMGLSEDFINKLVSPFSDWLLAVATKRVHDKQAILGHHDEEVFLTLCQHILNLKNFGDEAEDGGNKRWHPIAMITEGLIAYWRGDGQENGPKLYGP
ncbi:MAG: hypothetical protein ACRCTY_05425, partial [Candidatus Adiutrix sp.]